MSAKKGGYGHVSDISRVLRAAQPRNAMRGSKALLLERDWPRAIAANQPPPPPPQSWMDLRRRMQRSAGGLTAGEIPAG